MDVKQEESLTSAPIQQVNMKSFSNEGVSNLKKISDYM